MIQFKVFSAYDMSIIKICALAVTSAAVCLLLSSYCRGFTAVFSVSCVVILFGLLYSGIGDIVDFVRTLDYGEAQGSLVEAVLKSVGVLLVCEISADICERSGEPSLSKLIILAGKVEIMLIGLPLIRTVIDTAMSLCI